MRNLPLVWSSVLFGLVVVGGCQEAAAPKVDVATLEWPQLSLSQVDEDLAQWLRAQQEELRATVLEAPADTAKAAKIFGELGLILDAWEQADDALLCYDNAARLDPKNPRWPHLAGLIDRDAGRSEEALGRLRAALARDPNYPATRSYLAELLLDLGQTEAAREAFLEVLRRDPASAVANHGLGQLALQQGQAQAAVDYFEAALAAQPTATRVRYPLAQALREAGRADEAADTLARAGRAQPTVADPSQQLLAEVRAQTALRLVGEMAANTEGVTDLELLRFTLTQLSQSEGAVAALERTLAGVDAAAAPRQAARLGLAIAGLEIYAGADGPAIERLRRAVGLAPAMTEGWLKLGNALARLGRLEEAEQAFGRAVELEPEGDGLLARATIKLNRGDAAGALADLRRLAAARPGDGVVRVRVAEAREVAGDLNGAFAELQNAAGSETLDGAARARVARGLGDFLIRRGRHDQAVLAFRHALELDPTSSTLRLALAEVLGHLGRWPEAIAEFERVIVEQPSNEQARRGELVALMLQRDWQRAATRLDGALAQLPESAALAELGARLLAASPEAAVRQPQRALELAFLAWNSGESAGRADTVALAWGATERYAEAIEWEQRAIRMGTNAAEATARLQVYRRGEVWIARSPVELLGSPG